MRSVFCWWIANRVIFATASASDTTNACLLDNIPLGKGITGAAAGDAGDHSSVDDILTDPRYISSHPDIRSEVAVPLVVQDRVVGVMDLEASWIGYFNDEHVRTLSLLAPQIANSVENARLYEELAQSEQRMEQDLKAARRVQSILLPREGRDRRPGDRDRMAPGPGGQRRSV